MLTIAIVCGAGIATSALVAEQVREHIAARGRRVTVVQATVMDLLSSDFHADLVVSTVDLLLSVTDRLSRSSVGSKREQVLMRKKKALSGELSSKR